MEGTELENTNLEHVATMQRLDKLESSLREALQTTKASLLQCFTAVMMAQAGVIAGLVQFSSR